MTLITHPHWCVVAEVSECYLVLGTFVTEDATTCPVQVKCNNNGLHHCNFQIAKRQPRELNLEPVLTKNLPH